MDDKIKRKQPKIQALKLNQKSKIVLPNTIILSYFSGMEKIKQKMGGTLWKKKPNKNESKQKKSFKTKKEGRKKQSGSSDLTYESPIIVIIYRLQFIIIQIQFWCFFVVGNFGKMWKKQKYAKLPEKNSAGNISKKERIKE